MDITEELQLYRRREKKCFLQLCGQQNELRKKKKNIWLDETTYHNLFRLVYNVKSDCFLIEDD